MTKIFYQKYQVLNHTYILGATKKGLAFVGSQDQSVAEISKFYPHVELVQAVLNGEYVQQLEEYLTGRRQEFDLPLDISGTDFQVQVWRQLLEIPYGQTVDYTQLAEAIGRPKASRAVGTAVGKNPVLMIVPCHRVITKSGQLGGYRGGLAMKQDLLQLEENKKG